MIMSAERARMRIGDVFVTGASGLVGARAIERLLSLDDAAHVHALVRRPAAWPMLAARLGPAAARVTPVTGDVTEAGLGLEAATRQRLAAQVHAVVHCAADTTFSRPLEQARAVNTAGTCNLLELVADWRIDRLVHVSTAFVAGARTGVIHEAELDGAAGFVNGYEQSKHEAEVLVRDSGLPYVVLRPSTIVCDDGSGGVTQYNAVHRALRVFSAGLASLMPGAEDTPVDVVTTEHVAAGVTDIGFAPDAAGTYHLCAGAGALGLGELLDRAHAIWSRDAQWRRRGIVRPALTDLATYRLFEQSVEETGDVRLTTITRSLSHFVPQLALPKQFATAAADAALGRSAPPVRSFWDALLEHLVATRWGSLTRSAA
jgi:thioester reductase-like protein